MWEKRIYIIDKLVIGYNHVIFNASVTSIIAGIHSDKEVFFIAESIHTKVIENKNEQIANLRYEPYLESPLPDGKLKKVIPWIRKKIGDLIFIKKTYEKKLPDAYSIFFTCLSTTSLLYAGYKARHLKVPVYFFMHGELEFVFTNKISFVNKLKGTIYKVFLKSLGSTSKVIVLSNIIKNDLIKSSYLPAEKIITIEHPIIPVNYCDKPLNNNKIIFGHIGIAMKKKSSEHFFELAAKNLKSIADTQAEFQLIGKIEHGLSLQNNTGVVIVSENNSLITQQEYEQYIANIDYAIFTFNEENYVYRVSGSVMDAIAFAKPIVALKQSYFNYLFETAGNIGFLCNDTAELDILVKRLISKDKYLLHQYIHQQENLKLLGRSLTVDEIKNKLSAVI